MTIQDTIDESQTLIQDAIDEADAVRPDEPSLPLGEWMQKNLFSSIPNAFLTVIFGLIGLWSYRGILNFVFSENRRWDAIRVNLRLLFTQAYPDENYTRIWVSLGIIMILSGLSLAMMRVGPGISLKKIATWLFTGGALIAAGVLLREPSVLTDADGASVLDANDQVVRESFADAMGNRISWWILAAVLFAVGAAIWIGLGDLRRRTTFIPSIPLALAGFAFVVSTTWWYGWGDFGFFEGEYRFNVGERVATTTRNPWTVMFVLILVSYLIGRALKRTSFAGTTRVSVTLLWLLSPFITFFGIMRRPLLDWDHVWSTDLPMGVAFIVGGALLLWLLTRPGLGEIGRIIAITVLAFAIFNWVAAFFGWYPMLQKARISFALLGLAALLAPNFVGETKQRMKLVWGWIGLMIVVHVLATLINTPTGIEVPTEDFAGGFLTTLVVAVFTLIFSFPLGVLLALARTSKMPLFRILSTIYIEAFRGVPLITMLFFFTVFVNLFLPEGMELSSLAAVVVAFTLFSAAYLAENVRGGLQSIRQGQYEASDALGLTTVQRTMFIVLPQGLRASIPPLVGQVIGTYKETSLLAIVGIFDFLLIARNIIPAQTEFLGVLKEGLLFISVFYFIGAYSMSKYSQRLEKQLGVGER